MIDIKDIPNFSKTVAKFGFQMPTGLTILPANIQSAEKKADLLNAETTSTLRVLLKQAGILEKPLSDEKIPEVALKSFDWIGPTLFIASTFIIQNSQIIDLTIELIKEYLSDWFKGVLKEERNVELDIITQNKSGSYSNIHYQGNVEGLKELPKIVRSTHDEC